jgi:subfamily B ATP-binding cassette protein MsbA
MIAMAVIQTGFAWLIKPIMNDGLIAPKMEWISVLPFVVMLMLLVQALSNFVGTYAMSVVGRGVIRDLRTEIFSRLIDLSAGYFDQHSSSTIVSKLIYDVEQTATATTDTLTAMVKDVLATVGLLGLMFYLDWKLTVIFLVFIPVVVAVMRHATRRFRKTSQRIQDSVGGIAHVTNEAAQGQRVVKTYGGQQQEREAFAAANQHNFRQTMKRAVVSAAVVPVTTLCLGIPLAIILYVYLNYLRTGPESAGDFASYLAALFMVTSPIKRLAKVNEKIQIGITAANSAFQIIDTEPEPDHGDKEMGRANGEIRMSGVHFGYRGGKSVVLEDVDLEVMPGQRIALVGPSGSGKSTITSLLLRLYPPEKGQITLDGIDIQELRLKDLRRQIAIVSQDTVLFDDTIRRNILYGMVDEEDDERLNTVVSAAHIDEFVKHFPDGLDTQVGEHGLRLSGGQRQRIAIARALYKNAPILILDEATSALDTRSERLVQDATETLMEGRTTLLIAHRLTTIEGADQILVLQEGRIVEQGRHAELLEKSGVYADLHRVQSEKVLRNEPFQE